ncbi:hypothetical protein ABH15_07960 [Methanoculleus taiwanensis]|uniref:Protein-glutamine gamma-glutamyltransferase-like C-terminal domain-containing protein n=1 Tax=Methanoculleus taiwanensis TaxID=1550565 RepID=A0A498H2D0_9EURY|nr:DUF4129 domain-containing protein [Methanoculleus taiwanensis]RXE56106.1 hypothetical protein ABH15_07960 [Methanoculleus taiwanensis]
MKRRYTQVLLVVLAVLFFALIAQYAASPALYTFKSDSDTPFHQNPEALKQISREQSQVLLPLMSEVLDNTGTLVLNIKLKDFESAERDLQQYMEQSRRLDSMVINLDMSETELEEFRRNNKKNVESMQSLLNDTRRFQELQSLEIRYRDENRPDLLYSVSYEGEALRSQIAENFKGYRSRESAMVNTSSRFELDTTTYEQSIDDFEEIVEEIEAKQETRRTETPAPPTTPQRLSIAISPDTGVYQDRLWASGELTGKRVGRENVTLYIDSKYWTTVATGDDGRYGTTFTVDRIRAGKHLAYAVHGSTYSEVVTFTVLPLDTVLTLEVVEGARAENRTLAGSLRAGEIPVADAPVRLTADGRTIATATTDDTGNYTLEQQFEAGTYRVTAIFESSSFPLNGTESAPVLVEIAPSLFGSPIFVYGGFLLLAAIGSVWYIRRRRGQPGEPAAEALSEERADLPDEPAVEEPLPGEDENAAEKFARLVAGGRISDAVHALYLHLAGRIAKAQRIDNHLAMTPRELLAACRRLPLGERLAEFVRRYEAVRYGGKQPTDEERRELAGLFEQISEDTERDAD